MGVLIVHETPYCTSRKIGEVMARGSGRDVAAAIVEAQTASSVIGADIDMLEVNGPDRQAQLPNRSRRSEAAVHGAGAMERVDRGPQE